MKEFHLFAHFAENDPAPNVVTEALACGLPVLYHSSGGTPEIVQGSDYGTAIGKLSLEEMRAALTHLLSRYSSLIEKIKRDRNRFLISSSLTSYVDIFRSVGKRGPS
jgi:glycosyltransferase involved in cell wall biosynthesis